MRADSIATCVDWLTGHADALANAQLAGVERMDVYMFPCYPCGDPAGQVEAAVRSLANSTYTRFWYLFSLSQFSYNST